MLLTVLKGSLYEASIKELLESQVGNSEPIFLTLLQEARTMRWN